MGSTFFDAARQGLQGLLELIVKLGLPIAIVSGLVWAAAIVRHKRDSADPAQYRHNVKLGFSYVALAFLMVALWSGLKAANPRAREALAWKDSAQASDNPKPEAPPIIQPGPVIAKIFPKTYTRSLVLPPEFLSRLGTDGVAALAPYLSDPSAENVTKLSDSFRRNGTDVTFTRELTRDDEVPLAFDRAQVVLTVHRLQGDAFETAFVARYYFSNPTQETVKTRFLFALPQAGTTVRDLSVKVGDNESAEPEGPTTFAWKGTLGPQEKRTATVTYSALGGRNWSYDLGSSRRTVKEFSLTVTSDGPVKFQRMSLLPSSRATGRYEWLLSNVVTSQQVGLQFEPDSRERDGLLQAMSLLPVALALVVVGVFVFGFLTGSPVGPGPLLLALAASTFGFGATVVLADYAPPVVAFLVGPLLSSVLIGRGLGWRAVPVLLPLALLPATALSPTHTGLWVLAIAVAEIFAITSLAGRQAHHAT